jgi:hypothetical protein
VVSERDGVWSKAIAVSSLRGARSRTIQEVSSVACGAPGNCTAVGASSDEREGFAITDRNDIWGKVTLIADVHARRQLFISSIACVSAGNCAAGGIYFADLPSSEPAFVISERHGVWSKAIRVPGLATIGAQVLSLSCTPERASAAGGYCAAGGEFLNHTGNAFGFVVTERHDP